ERRRDEGVLVVVSALSGISDALIATMEAASRSDALAVERLLEGIAARHRALLADLGADDASGPVEEILAEIGELARGVTLVRESTGWMRARFVGAGELLSSRIVAEVVAPAEWLDAREVVRTAGTDPERDPPQPDEIAALVRERWDGPWPGRVAVTQGFIGSASSGGRLRTTLLGRGGSDYTASLLGAALAAERVEIWTDVDGVLSADPRRVEAAFSLPRLSYDELLELSHFGAKVVYPPTVHPARKAAIPLLIKNTLNPSFPGTVVLAEAGPSDAPIRGISSISRVALLRIEGDGMIEVPGTAGRFFKALGEAGINVILISQASSEHSICIAVDPQRAAAARDVVNGEFATERA